VRRAGRSCGRLPCRAVSNDRLKAWPMLRLLAGDLGDVQACTHSPAGLTPRMAGEFLSNASQKQPGARGMIGPMDEESSQQKASPPIRRRADGRVDWEYYDSLPKMSFKDFLADLEQNPEQWEGGKLTFLPDREKK